MTKGSLYNALIMQLDEWLVIYGEWETMEETFWKRAEKSHLVFDMLSLDSYYTYSTYEISRKKINLEFDSEIKTKDYKYESHHL